MKSSKWFWAVICVFLIFLVAWAVKNKDKPNEEIKVKTELAKGNPDSTLEKSIDSSFLVVKKEESFSWYNIDKLTAEDRLGKQQDNIEKELADIDSVRKTTPPNPPLLPKEGGNKDSSVIDKNGVHVVVWPPVDSAHVTLNKEDTTYFVKQLEKLKIRQTDTLKIETQIIASLPFYETAWFGALASAVVFCLGLIFK